LVRLRTRFVTSSVFATPYRLHSIIRLLQLWSPDLDIEALSTAARALGVRVLEDEFGSNGVLHEIHHRANQVHDCLRVHEHLHICKEQTHPSRAETPRGTATRTRTRREYKRQGKTQLFNRKYTDTRYRTVAT
jgi:hypothetical protein